MRDNRPILLVEDDEIDQEAVRRSFARLKIRNSIVPASNGEEGLAYLQGVDELPLLVLLDLNMPRMNGIEFLEAVKEDKVLRRIPVVVFTTSVEETDKLKTYNLGIAGFIQKPTDPSQLREVFRVMDLYWSLNEFPAGHAR